MDYKIIGKVIDIKGTCAAGLKVGDKIDLTIPCLSEDYKEWKKKPKICPHLLTSTLPQVLILQSGGKIPSLVSLARSRCALTLFGGLNTVYLARFCRRSTQI